MLPNTHDHIGNVGGAASAHVAMFLIFTFLVVAGVIAFG